MSQCCRRTYSADVPRRLACLGAQIDLVQGMMDCLYATCIPCITDCVLAELEKLGQKYRVALKVAKARSLPSRIPAWCNWRNPAAMSRALQTLR